jgi:uncharacterized membrane protein YjjP (DUF1212 family)
MTHAPTHADTVFLIELAQALHAAGASATRLETAMAEVSARIGVEAQVFASPTAMFVGVGPPGAQQLSLLRMEPSAIGLSALQQLDDVVTRVADGSLSLEAAIAELRAMRRQPSPWPWWATLLAWSVSSGAAARFLGGGGREVVASALVGLCSGGLALAARRHTTWQRVLEPAAALLAAVLAPVLGLALGKLSVLTVTVAGLVAFLPSLALTTALSELATRHLVAGTTRLAGAMAVFLTLGLGVALGHEIAAHLPRVPEPHTRLPEWTLWLALALAPLAVAVQLRATPRQLFPAVAAGVLAWMAARGGAQWFDPELGVFIATLALGTAGNLYAWVRKRPAAVVIVPGIVMLVPGSLGLRSVTWLAQSDVLHGLKTATQMMVAVVALVGGLLFANVLVPPRNGG